MIDEQIERTVVFDGATHQISQVETIHVNPGTTEIRFTLTTVNGNGLEASWSSTPFLFSGSASPPEAFESIQVGSDGKQAAMIDRNERTAEEGSVSFAFTMQIVFDGQTYAKDPVIINEPPIPDPI